MDLGSQNPSVVKRALLQGYVIAKHNALVMRLVLDRVCQISNYIQITKLYSNKIKQSALLLLEKRDSCMWREKRRINSRVVLYDIIINI